MQTNELSAVLPGSLNPKHISLGREVPVATIALNLKRSNIKVGDSVSISKEEEGGTFELSSEFVGGFVGGTALLVKDVNGLADLVGASLTVVIHSGKEVYSFTSKVIKADKDLGLVAIAYPIETDIYLVRKTTRINVDTAAHIAVRDGTDVSPHVSARIHNMSIGGVLAEISSDKEIPDGTVLECFLALDPNQIGASVKVIAVVRHNYAGLTESTRFYGLEFIWVGEAEARAIQAFLFKGLTH